MTDRRVPPPITDFVVGPAERVLSRVWAPAVSLLRVVQRACEDDAPAYERESAERQSYGAYTWLAGGCVRSLRFLGVCNSRCGARRPRRDRKGRGGTVINSD